MRNNKCSGKLMCTGVLALVLGAGAAVSAQGPEGGAPTPQPLVVHQLKPNLYWVEGGGGNSAVIVGNNGVIVVDTKTTAAGRSGVGRRRRQNHAETRHHGDSYA